MCCLLAGGIAAAQTGSLEGLVMDGSGRVVPRAAINLVNQLTGVQRATHSDNRGVYVLGALPAGEYRVVVRMDGFKSEVRVGIRIGSGEDARLDFTLRIGEMRKTVTVTASPDARQVEAADPGIIVAGDDLAQLPLSGGNLLGVLELQPGILTTPVRAEDPGQFSANGQRAGMNSMTVDGVSANVNVSGAAQAWGGGLPALTAIGSMHTIGTADAIDSMQIRTTDSYAASMRLPGAQVAIVTRSGSNEFHGSGFYAFRDGALDSNDWFRNRGGLGKAPMRVDDYGFTLGGPIRKSRTFFFANLDGLRLNAPVTATTGVPDQAAVTVHDPLSDAFLRAFRPANGPSIGLGLAWRTGSGAQQGEVRTASVRVDHSFASGKSLFVRWQHAPSSESDESSYAYQTNSRRFSEEHVTAGFLATFESGAHAEARFGRTWVRMRDGSSLDQTPGGAPSLQDYVPAAAVLGPGAYTVGFLGSSSIASGIQNVISQGQVDASGSLAVDRGRHQWRFGGDYRRTATGIAGAPTSVIALFTSLDGVAAGDLYLMTIARHNPVRLADTQVSVFADDRYAIAPRLTLHYGLRLEFEPPLRAGAGAPAFATAEDTTAWTDLRIARSGAFWKARYPEFAPRAGLAYQPAEGWMVRAGGGVFYGYTAGAVAPGVENRPPYSTAQLYLSVSRQTSAASIVPPSFDVTPPYVSAGGFDRGLRAPQVWQWTTTLERTLGRDVVLEGAWVGTLGESLLRREIIVAPTPTFVSLDFATGHGASQYNAFQLLMRRRSAGPFFWTIGYTFSKSLDNGSRDGEATLPENRSLDWGRSSFDARHALSAAVTWSPRWLRGWAVDGILRARSGMPIDVNGGLGAQGSGSFVLLRPDLQYGQEIWLPDANAPGGRRLNPAAFAATDGSRQGTLGRNVINGFAFSQLDLSAARTFRLSRSVMELRLDAFNVMNHPNFANPQETILVSTPNFGQSLSLLNGGLTSDLFGLDALGSPNKGLSPVLQIGGPRALQLSLRLRF